MPKTPKITKPRGAYKARKERLLVVIPLRVTIEEERRIKRVAPIAGTKDKPKTTQFARAAVMAAVAFAETKGSA